MNTRENIAGWIGRITRDLEAAGLHYGHGTDNAGDEAAWLVLHAVKAPLDGSFTDWGRPVEADEATIIERLCALRCSSRKPLAYLTGSAFFAGLEFEVSEDVLVPRSPIGELVGDGFRPWVDPQQVRRVLDMCTGSGCIAIASAVRLSRATVDAADISPAALRVAARNVARHGLSGRVRLLESDLFKSVPACRYDLIVANPPYVPESSLATLPGEYRREPGLGLVSGDDGLDAALQIMLDAPRFLGEDGVLVCEVGESDERLARAAPEIPFLWLEFARGGSGVFVLTRQQLEEAGALLAAIMEKRRHVT